MWNHRLKIHTWILSISRFKNQHHKYNLNWVQFMKSFSSSPCVGFYENFLGKHVSTIASTPRPQCNLMEMQRNFPVFFFFCCCLFSISNFEKKNTWQYHALEMPCLSHPPKLTLNNWKWHSHGYNYVNTEYKLQTEHFKYKW